MHPSCGLEANSHDNTKIINFCDCLEECLFFLLLSAFSRSRFSSGVTPCVAVSHNMLITFFTCYEPMSHLLLVIINFGVVMEFEKLAALELLINSLILNAY